MSIGLWQIILILLIVLIVFGSGKLPKVMEDLAKGLKSFREGMGGHAEGPHPVKEPKKIPAYKKQASSATSSKKIKKHK